MQWAQQQRHGGFTIVELLIVVVVIAILAAIVIVSYNGISLNARNTARISTAFQAMKVINMYTSQNGSEPLRSAVASVSGCYGKGLPDVNNDGVGDCRYNGTSASTSNVAALDTLLETTGAYGRINYPPVIDTYAGPQLVSFSGSVNGGPNTNNLQLRYYLEGTDQSCGVSGILTLVSTGVWTTSGAKNTGGAGGTTACLVYIPAS